jgi:hypothetical protein
MFWVVWQMVVRAEQKRISREGREAAKVREGYCKKPRAAHTQLLFLPGAIERFFGGPAGRGDSFATLRPFAPFA